MGGKRGVHGGAKGVAQKELPPHGTVARYRSRVDPCHECDACRAAWAEYQRDYRATHPAYLQAPARRARRKGTTT